MDVTFDAPIDDQLTLNEVPQPRTVDPEPGSASAELTEVTEVAGQLDAENGASGLALSQVGPRLRQLRQERAGTLAGLARATGISISTLSRLESGQRRPSLELLLPITRAYQVPLDDLVADVEVGDPRVIIEPNRRGDLVVQPLSRRPSGAQAYRMSVPHTLATPQLQAHDGYEWVYVLNGRLRLVLGDQDTVLELGEAAEFDTRLPHWFGSTGEDAVEFLSLLGPQGERIHLQSRARRDQRSA